MANSSKTLPSELSADDLDKESTDQLHAFTLQMSGNCFELKKLCATVLVGAGTLISALAHGVDLSIFAAGLCVTAVFWAADSQSYYLQSKARIKMRALQHSRTARHTTLKSYQADGVGLPVRAKMSNRRSIIQSFLNASMLYYLLILILILVGILAFEEGWMSK